MFCFSPGKSNEFFKEWLERIFLIRFSYYIQKGWDSMPIYNKLVRDKIPEIIKSSGKEFRTKQLNEAEYIKELRTKLNEEISEYLEAATDAQALEELADVLEIIHSLAVVHGSNFEAVEDIRKAKHIKRGGFQEKIFLIDVED